MATSKEEDSLCRLCKTQKFMYVCPRCNVPYCSVSCYKSETHLQCSESFYKDWVDEELKNRSVDDESRKKMLDILLKYQKPDEEELDSDDDSDISDRLNGIDLNDADSVWEKLTAEERQEFVTLVKSGDITKLVPLWTPWWSKKLEKKKVKFVDDEDENYEQFKKSCPPITYTVPKFSSISKKVSSMNSSILYNLTNVLGSYTLCSRYYNGEQQTFPLEAASVIINISLNLCKNHVFNSQKSAISSILHEATSSPLIQISDDDDSTINNDVKLLLEGPNQDDRDFFVLAALNDMRSLFVKARKLLKTPKNSSATGNFSKNFGGEGSSAIFEVSVETLYKSIKKLEFYMSWSVEFLKDLVEVSQY